MPMYIQRHSNIYYCPGTCKKKSCKYVRKGFRNIDHLNDHLGLNRIQCPICLKHCLRNSEFFLHFRTVHDTLLNSNDGCSEFGVPDKRPSPLKPPPDLKDYKGAFQIIKVLIKQYLLQDKKRKEEMIKSIKKHKKKSNMRKANHFIKILNNYKHIIRDTNQNRHNLAVTWLRYLIDHNRMNTFQHESGLIIKYQFQKHGGLFQISLDRINNNYPHFYGSLNAFQNVRDVPFCLNTSSNPMAHYPNLKKEVLLRLNAPSTLSINTLNDSSSTCYKSINHIWNSKRLINNQVEHYLLKNTFYNRENFQSYCLNLLRDQNYKCAVSGINLINGNYKTRPSEKVFAMSINAINPTLGHVKGNIEWVCRFINVINNEKQKKVHHKDDPPNGWTKELFKKYFLK
jgi:hypothetical protein